MAFVPLITIEGAKLLEALPKKMEEANNFLQGDISKTEMIEAKKTLASLKLLVQSLVGIKESIVQLSSKQREECKVNLTELVEVLLQAKECVCELEVQINEHSKKEEQFQPFVTQNASNDEKKPNVKLPKLELQKFNGQITKFAEFWEAFETSVDHSTTITQVEKFIFLRSYVTGNAANLLQGLSLTAANYEIAKNLLQNRYGDKQIIINAHYNALRKLNKAEYNTKSLRNTLDIIEKNLRCLEVLKENVNHNSLLSIIYEKFPSEILITIEEKNDVINMEILRNGLNKLITSRERVENFSNSNQKAYQNFNENQPSTSNAKISNINKPLNQMKIICKFCGKDHFSDVCDEYKTLEQRKQKVKNLCNLCLKDNHEIKQCNYTKSCYYCKKKKKHHQSLCPEKFGSVTTFVQPNSLNAQNEKETKKKESNVVKPTNTTAFLTQAQQKETATLTYAEVTFVESDIKATPTKVTHSTLAILDTGSEKSYITEDLVKKLKLKPEYYESLTIGQFGGTSTHTETGVISINLKLNDNLVLTIKANSVKQITGDSKNRLLPNDFCKSDLLKNLDFADKGNYHKTELLIGNDYLFDLLTLEKIKIREHLYLIGSKLGWLLAGRITSEEQNQVNTTCLLSSLGDPIQKIWSLDTIGIRENPKETENDEAVKTFYDQVKYENNTYTVSWPWKKEIPDLPTNYGLALGQLQSLTKRMNSDMLEKYGNIFDEQENKGIIEVVNENKSDLCHYLPHHGVYTPDKTTKMRIVHNGSAKTKKNNPSLNDCLLKGRVLLEDLTTHLLRFRKKPIALIADIEKAFLQINLNEKDRDVVRFLWLKNPKEGFSLDNIKVYRFTRVPFGIISSPFLLGMVINYHLQKFPDLHHFSEEFYVDNLISGADSEKEALEIYDKLKECFNSASMNLREWNSNSESVKNYFKEADKNQDEETGILGLIWNVKKDTLQIKLSRKIKETLPITKRLALQQTSSIFDPLGFFAPITLMAKIFIKNLWSKKVEWDDIVGESDQQRWLEIKENLIKISDMQIDRFIGNFQGHTTSYQIHCFTDASKNGYAAVIYIRIKEEENVNVKLIFAKARVSPEKEISIPRLELIAATIGARMIKFVQKVFNMQSQTFLWSDSKCVLYWIQSEKILPIFIQRRVKEIKNGNHTCRYVPSKQNPADIASRSCTFDELNESYWWNGPIWLKADEENWPKGIEISVEDAVEEPIETKTLLVNENEIKPPFEIDNTRFSTMKKLLHTTAYIALAIKLFRKETVEKIINIEAAELKWIKYEQRRSYGSHYTPKIKGLNVFRDEAGVIRCKGRIENAEISIEEKYPILLPKCYFVELLIMKIHVENAGHSGTSHTLAALRSKYWIPQGRRMVYQTIKKRCFVCKRYDAKPFKPPQIAPLPQFRMDVKCVPFTNVGIDVFGPILVRVNIDPKQPKEKRWVMIFTCMTVRAIHLEVLEKMTSGEFLHAFRRFKARRTTPKIVISDNAPQFIVLENIIKELWKTITEDGEIQRYFAKEKIEWKRIPPKAPWMGGAYERLIQITKNSIKRTYHTITLSNRQLITVVAEIEGIVNSRPLTYIGQEPDCVILTPNHFLQVKFPAFNMGNPENLGTNVREKLVSLWKKSEEYLDQVWRYWQQHYLLSLRERSEKMKIDYRTTQRPPKVGEAVLIIDQPENRGSWKIAIIEKVIQSSDGNIRSVQLKTSENHTIRPISKIAPLELDIENCDEEQWELADVRDELQIPASNQNDEWANADTQQNVNEDLQQEDEFDEIVQIECLSLSEEEEI